MGSTGAQSAFGDIIRAGPPISGPGNFYEDLMNNQKIPDSGVLTQKVKEQIADQLKQAGQ